MAVKTFNLPSSQSASGRKEWRLDARGLEWTKDDGKDLWMPFACVRRATLGAPSQTGWRLRLSGPPGACLIEAGVEPSVTDIATFNALASAMIEGAEETGCRVRFAINHGQPISNFLWARFGKSAGSGGVLIAALPARG